MTEEKTTRSSDREKQKNTEPQRFSTFSFFLLIIIIIILTGKILRNPPPYFPSKKQQDPDTSILSMNPEIPPAKVSGLSFFESLEKKSPENFGPAPPELQVIRIATWNLMPLDFEKVTDLSRSLKITEILLKFDIIAIQGIRSNNYSVLESLVYLLRQKGGNYSYACSSTVSRQPEYLAFLFNLDRIDIDRETVVDFCDSQNRLTYPALTAAFRPSNVDRKKTFTFRLINIWIDPRKNNRDRDALQELYLAVREKSGRSGIPEDDIIMLGSFNCSIYRIGALSRVADIVAIHADKHTTSSGKSDDNIFFNGRATTEYIERFGVIDIGEYFHLSPLETENISRHRPVWADFSVFESGNSDFSQENF